MSTQLFASIDGAGGVGAAPGVADAGIGVGFATGCGVGSAGAAGLAALAGAGAGGGSACTNEQARARTAAGTRRDGSFIAEFRPANNKAPIVADGAGHYTGNPGH